MRKFAKFLVIAIVFCLGTVSLIHVDRQCSEMNGQTSAFENLIEK